MKKRRPVLKWIGIALAVLIVTAAVILLASIDLSNPDDLDTLLENKFSKSNLPGMAITITKGDEIAYFKGLGYANRKEKQPVTEETIFQLASISKLITGTAVMQLVEQGAIDLDADVSDYLPFAVKNPNHPETAITPRMLLTHTSSIRDDWKVYDSFYTIQSGGGDSPVTLAEFLPGYLVAGGEWYNAETMYYTAQPGTENHYSNVGYALLGYLVEVISGQDFSEYCHEHIFEPLEMVNTGWRFSEIDMDKMSVQYERKFWLYQRALPPYGFVTYPDGCLKTSSEDWAHFLIAMQNGGSYNGSQILKPETVAAMWTPQVPEIAPTQGLTWELDTLGEFWVDHETPTPGHTGGDPGITTITFLLPENDTSVTIFINGEFPFAPRMENLMRMIERLIAEAESI